MGEIRITFCGGAGTATGANFLVETEDGKILIDCGLTQGISNSEELNRTDFPYDPASVKTLLVTHAHADHIGLIPKLVKAGFSGTIYSTEPTKQIASALLEDSANLMEAEARKKGKEPLYGKQDVLRTLSLWRSISYHEPFDARGTLCIAKNAGHILGSAIYKISFKNGKTAAFTGDLGNIATPLLNPPETVDGANFLVMESVYGDRNHEGKDERRGKLKDAVMEAAKRRATLVIPVFSIERTQVVLYELNMLVESGEVSPIPVFLDSPLAAKITNIYESFSEEFKPAVQEQIRKGDDIFSFPKFSITNTAKESGRIAEVHGAKIIMAGSGMSEGGRVIGHEKRYLSDSNAMLLMVGYQAPGTLGRQLKDGAKNISMGGENFPVRAEIRTIEGYSSHMDSDHLLDFVEQSRGKLERVFVCMGEPRASMFLAQKIRDNLGIDAVVPKRGDIFDF